MQEPDFGNDNEELEIPDELTSLKERADLMGISYHPSIGVEKLREKIKAKLDGEAPVEEETAPAPVAAKAAVAAATPETESQKRQRKKREASELIRVRVTCMNPNKKEWEGEIITAGNAVVGTFKKFVPFDVEEGWHIPRIIYNQLVQRQCQIFQSSKDSRGNSVRKSKLIREFSIEILPPLTKAELHDLAQRQAMAKSID